MTVKTHSRRYLIGSSRISCQVKDLQYTKQIHDNLLPLRKRRRTFAKMFVFSSTFFFCGYFGWSHLWNLLFPFAQLNLSTYRVCCSISIGSIVFLKQNILLVAVPGMCCTVWEHCEHFVRPLWEHSVSIVAVRRAVISCSRDGIEPHCPNWIVNAPAAAQT